jgi:hypothetical protein
MVIHLFFQIHHLLLHQQEEVVEVDVKMLQEMLLEEQVDQVVEEVLDLVLVQW